jgi:DNA anti-recombination protein RmuC
MLLLLLKFKSYIQLALILITLSALTYGYYWHSQYGKSQAVIAQQLKEKAVCEANNSLLQSGVQRWKAAAAQYEQQLKRREALVAKQTAESNKRIKAILQKQYSPNCDEAIQQGIEQANQPHAELASTFHWNNNIP